MKNCVFCQMVAGKLPFHKIWEDKKYVGFLSIFPNTEGFSVVIPKKHYSSYYWKLPDNVLREFIVAVKKVALLLDKKLDDVGRTGMIFEGFGVDHVHAKLFPMHGTKNIGKWRPLSAKGIKKYFKKYEGYISSHDYERADDKVLKKLADKIKS